MADQPSTPSPDHSSAPISTPPPSSPPEPPAFTPFPPRIPIVMGVPGESAFSRYTRPAALRHCLPMSTPLPALRPLSSSPRRQRLSDYASSSSTLGFAPPIGPQAVPVGSGNPIAPAPPPPAFGRSRLGQKRGLEAGEGSGAIQPPGEGAAAGVNCSVCGKRFVSDKALFGHMRSHPDRGWKGAHPPPAFRAEEEFADIRAAASAATAAAAVEGSSAAAAEAEGIPPTGSNEEVGKGSGSYQVPDLNNSPPPDDDPTI